MVSGRSGLSGRPWRVWSAFALCAAVLLAAMGWLTAHARRIDRERSAARAEAALEQRVSLVLWRMDTKLAPLIAEEVARPYLYYDSFITLQQPAGRQQPIHAPSPLLAGRAENVLLNFDVSLDGRWKSPQAPQAEERLLALSNGLSLADIQLNCSRLDELARMIDLDDLVAQLPQQPLPSPPAVQQELNAPSSPLDEAPAEQQAVQPFIPNFPHAGDPAEPSGANIGTGVRQPAQVIQQFDRTQQTASTPHGYGDLGERNTRFQQAAQEEFSKQRVGNSYLLNSPQAAEATVIENASRPVWIGGQLLLARRVVRNGETFVQGSWLDWPRLKKELLAEARDLLPKAELAPVYDHATADPTRMLAGLPVQLVVGNAARALSASAAADGPLHWALALGWIALVLAVAAVAALLWGVVALSERRAAFVSAVTHELRTPLTTFRMYAEMLSQDMVPSAERRRQYLSTLKTEAERLTHLVENVLAYARLERGRRPQRNERTTVAALVERFEPRLAERATQSDMHFKCQVANDVAQAALWTDVGVIEQILFNLVDNAAKYAGRAADRRIELAAARRGKFAELAVCDHGPGFASPRDAARSAPFHKSAEEAAESAPGVGLGLSLCRRLARELGGRLEIAPHATAGQGARVTLTLPLDE